MSFIDGLKSEEYSELITWGCQDNDPLADDVINKYRIMALSFDYITCRYNNVCDFIANKLILNNVNYSDDYINKVYFCIKNRSISKKELDYIKLIVKKYNEKIKL